MTNETTFNLLWTMFVVEHPLMAWPLLALVTLGAILALLYAITKIVQSVGENRIRTMSVRSFRRRKGMLK